jgi:CPA1 family monovalent cation:H+ antiporter
VLAVVALGITQSQLRVNAMTPQIRLEATPVWEVVVFLLNGLIFILIGLQLPTIVALLSKNSMTIWLIDALVICATVILARIVWVFPATYLPRLPRWVRVRDPFPA